MFCLLILHPAVLMNVFALLVWWVCLFWGDLLYDSIEFSIHRITSPANKDNFTFSFLIWVSFSYLIALPGTSSAMLNRSGESGCPCLIPDLTEKPFILLPLTVGFS